MGTFRYLMEYLINFAAMVRNHCVIGQRFAYHRNFVHTDLLLIWYNLVSGVSINILCQSIVAETPPTNLRHLVFLGGLSTVCTVVTLSSNYQELMSAAKQFMSS